ncbi:uncharacterized protein LOC129592528 [Paramacrobiotus metropolitanus]|uniref:uncharacterized protein LOC129592528 n=1 Tax=Paramacrobiotus metropolitanus TaxID=2943436 RepID=UPI002445E593|nr:uncharacterized protein LOC129592528 [Paramacrobiotus metropolitanus]
MQLYWEMYQWNAVDVKVDGVLQHGFVVGLHKDPRMPPRLIVDFGCPGQQSVLVDHGKAFDCSTYPRYTVYRVREGENVEVLLRDHPNRPRKWYPGKVLVRMFANQNLQDFIMVEVARAGYRSAELVFREQVRLPSSEEDLRQRMVQPGEFVMQTCRVPDGYWTEWTRKPAEGASLLGQVENSFGVRFFNILSQSMHSVRRTQKPHVTDEDVAQEFKRVRRQRRRFRKWRGTKTSVDVKEMLNGMQCSERFSLALSLNVLREVFHSLDTVDRQRCRRTSQLWEAILSSAEMSKDVLVSREDCGFSRVRGWDWPSECDYAVYACIFKYVTPATRTVCIRPGEVDGWMGHEDFARAYEAVELIKQVLDTAEVRVDRLVERQRSLTIQFDQFNLQAFFAEMVAQISRLASCCDRLFWEDYTLQCEDRRSGVLMKFRIPFAVFAPANIDEAQIWDVFEKHLCAGTCLCDGWILSDAQHIARRLANLTNTRARAKGVKKILENFQACDPRPSAHYRGHKWTLYNVAAADLSKMNKFCLHTLWRYIWKWEGPSADEESSDSSEDD